MGISVSLCDFPGTQTSIVGQTQPARIGSRKLERSAYQVSRGQGDTIAIRKSCAPPIVEAAAVKGGRTLRRRALAPGLY